MPSEPGHAGDRGEERKQKEKDNQSQYLKQILQEQGRKRGNRD